MSPYLFDEFSLTSLPANSNDPNRYHGNPAECVSNAMQDANGDLLFFIVDGMIYDKEGYTIGDLTYLCN